MIQSTFHNRFHILHNEIIYHPQTSYFRTLKLYKRKVLVPPVGCPCAVEGPIPIASPNTSMAQISTFAF
jgi:hypothetical protein